MNKEVFTVVSYINTLIINDFYDKEIDEALIPILEIHSDGDNFVISYLGCDLWLSHDDEKSWSEDGNSQEPLFEFIVNKMIEVSNIASLQKDILIKKRGLI